MNEIDSMINQYKNQFDLIKNKIANNNINNNNIR